MKLVVLLLVLAVAVTAKKPAATYTQDFESFQSWMQTHNKFYASAADMQHAFENFQATVARVAEENARGTPTRFAVNKFADLSPAEFKARYLKFEPHRHPLPTADRIAPAPALSPAALPKEFDWRDKHAVTDVKDQGQCGSCWAFSVVENIESMAFLSGAKLTELSEQQVVDCDKVDQGCDGGDPDTAYQYIIGAGGLETEDDYPYEAFDDKCYFNASKVHTVIKNYTYAIPACNDTCSHQDETLLQNQLVNIGPLSICVDADDDWQDYDGGLYMGFCSSHYDEINHCVQLVGYSGTVKSGMWYVRNSWSSDWGEDGYIILGMGGNTCGLADWVTYANI